MRPVICSTSSECPPSSKKFCSIPTCLTCNSSSQMSASFASISFRGAMSSASSPNAVADNAASAPRSTLPVGRSGILSIRQ